MCLEIYGLDPADFRFAPTWKGALKTKLKLDISGGICNTIHRYAKACKKYIKDDNEKNILKMLTIGT